LKGKLQYVIDVKGFKAGEFQMQIVDMSGKEMYSKDLNEEEGIVNVNLAGGTYIVKLKSESGVMVVKKVVVM
jgi:hypothetical protein